MTGAELVLVDEVPVRVVHLEATDAGRHRTPADDAVATTPVDPSRTPLVARHPTPVAAEPAPATVVEREPAPTVIAVERPAGVAPHPAPACLVRHEVHADRGRIRNPHARPVVVFPLSVGRERLINLGVVDVAHHVARILWVAGRLGGWSAVVGRTIAIWLAAPSWSTGHLCIAVHVCGRIGTLRQLCGPCGAPYCGPSIRVLAGPFARPAVPTARPVAGETWSVADRWPCSRTGAASGEDQHS